MKVPISMIICLYLILPAVSGQKFISSKNEDKFKKEADELVSRIQKTGLLNGYILVSNKDNIFYEKKVGFADREKSIPFTMDTKFRIGSITKCFTAISFLQLSEQNKVNLHDPVSKFIPDFPNEEEITLHHLLSHTSGLPRDVKYDFSKDISIDDLLKKVDLKASRFKPGTEMRYSNVGYLLLTKIFEQLTSQRIEQYFHKNIIAPLGLENTGLEKANESYANFASGYKLGANEQGVADIQLADPLVHEVYRGVGALYSTPNDLLRFVRALGSTQLLSEASWEKMFTSYGKTLNGSGYGYGMFLYQDKDQVKLNHSGRINGFRVGFLYSPKEDRSILFFGNHDLAERDPILFTFDKMLSGKKYKLPEDRDYRNLPKRKVEKVIGKYKTKDFDFEIKKVGGQLTVVSHGDPPTPLRASDQKNFYALFFDLKLQFKYENGKVTSGEWIYRKKGEPFERIMDK